jgi:hypothetical protein
LRAFEQNFPIDAKYKADIGELLAKGWVKVVWSVQITPKGLEVLDDDMRSQNDG